MVSVVYDITVICKLFELIFKIILSDSYRLATFSDNWPKLEKWFIKFGSLKKIDASLDTDTVYTEVNSLLEESVAKVTNIICFIRLCRNSLIRNYFCMFNIYDLYIKIVIYIMNRI